MLPKMQQSHFVKKYSVQFVNANGKLSAPFYFWDNKPHECSQTWQVVRSEFDQMMLDNAREHGVEVHEGVRVVDVLFEGDARSASRVQDEDGARREVRAKVVVDASGQSGAAAEPLQAAPVGSGAEQGRDLDLLAGRLPRHRPRRRRDMVIQTANKKGWFWYIPLHDDIVSVGVVAPFDYLFKGRGESRADLSAKKSSAARPSSSASSNATRVTGYFATQGLLVSLDAGGRRRLGAGRRRVRLPRSALFVRRAAGAEIGRDGGRRDRRRACKRATRAAAQLGKWGPAFNEGVDRMRRLVCEYYDGFSFGNFVRHYPELRGTVTDLLIGDLFTDRVDKVWGPMESLYEPGSSADSDLARRDDARRGRGTRPTSWCCRTAAGPRRF